MEVLRRLSEEKIHIICRVIVPRLMKWGRGTIEFANGVLGVVMPIHVLACFAKNTIILSRQGTLELRIHWLKFNFGVPGQPTLICCLTRAFYILERIRFAHCSHMTVSMCLSCLTSHVNLDFESSSHWQARRSDMTLQIFKTKLTSLISWKTSELQSAADKWYFTS